MMKKLNVMMALALCCVFNLNSMDFILRRPLEEQFIDRSMKKNEIALNDYNTLLKKSLKGDFDYSSFEAKCLIDAHIAEISPKFSWSFKWLIPFVVSLKIDTIAESDYVLDYLVIQDNAVSDLEALKDAKQKAMNHKMKSIKTILKNDNMIKGIVSKAIRLKKITPGQSYDAYSRDLVESVLSKSTNTEVDMMQLRAQALQIHLKKPFTPQDNESRVFLEAPWRKKIKSIRVEEHLKNLKKDNPVDTNPTTNRYANLFDRLAY